MARADQNQHDEHLVVCVLGDELYALDIAAVKEIIAWEPVTRVPRVQGWAQGIINLRGHIIPVVDLRRRFGLPGAEIGRETRVVVVEMDQLVVGLVVDGVTEVLRVSSSQVETSVLTAGGDAEFVRGVAKTDKGLVLLLDVDRLLSDKEQGVLKSMADGPPADATVEG
ncbi:MAG: chemotaxis protein CheW [Limnochordia bacterium]